jgi:hypothetical protein
MSLDKHQKQGMVTDGMRDEVFTLQQIYTMRISLNPKTQLPSLSSHPLLSLIPSLAIIVVLHSQSSSPVVLHCKKT